MSDDVETQLVRNMALQLTNESFREVMLIAHFDGLNAIDRLAYLYRHGGPPTGWREYGECPDQTTSETSIESPKQTGDSTSGT